VCVGSAPVIVGTYAAYQEVVFPFGPKGKTYMMWDTWSCKAYVSAKNPGIFTDCDDELTGICRMVPIALIGQTIIAGAMYIMVSGTKQESSWFVFHFVLSMCCMFPCLPALPPRPWPGDICYGSP
jgi:hypothetical protein